MGDPRAQDLLSLDRDVASGWSALTRWRADLALDPKLVADEDPLESVRRVAGKSTWDALTTLDPSAADVPLRDALKRWVFTLTQARIGRPDEVAWERAASEALGRFNGRQPKRVSWREAWRGLVSATTSAEASLWLDAAAEAAPPLAAVARRSAARRVEVARRFGADHPWAPLVPVERGLLRDAARRLLDATDDLSRAVWKPRAGRDGGMAAMLHGSMAREAGDGWPAQLTWRWLDEVFRAERHGLRIAPTPLPPPLGAASFARALYAFGFAVRVATSASSMPFALSREPAFVGAHRLGFVFGELAADAEWQGRALGVGRRTALGQSRLLARTALLDARLHAARLLVGDDLETSNRDPFEEIGARLFQGGIVARLRGTWPRAREDEAARFVALLEARDFGADIRDRFDSDWYRNPRAWAHLRAVGVAAAHEAVDAQALSGRVNTIARAFDGALG
jgi:hypothetical protein